MPITLLEQCSEIVSSKTSCNAQNCYIWINDLKNFAIILQKPKSFRKINVEMLSWYHHLHRPKLVPRKQTAKFWNWWNIVSIHLINQKLSTAQNFSLFVIPDLQKTFSNEQRLKMLNTSLRISTNTLIAYSNSNRK